MRRSWSVPATIASGSYVLKVEVSLEGDFNAATALPLDATTHQPTGPYAALVDEHPEWDSGYQWNGQPSVVYAVPFRVDSTVRVAMTSDYAGYGDRLGQSGTLNPPDSTISTSNGSGAHPESRANR